MADAYPLAWPTGWNRTQYPQHARFGDHSIAYASYVLMEELRKLGATNIVLSSNVALKKDGMPYSGRKPPEDRGVAVYFTLFNEQQCIPCDKWIKVEHNIWAIAKSIEALRGLERWGAKEMVKASFRGFAALPEKASESKTSYFSDCKTKEEVTERYRLLAKEYHPDNEGDPEKFIDLTNQYQMKLRELK